MMSAHRQAMIHRRAAAPFGRRAMQLLELVVSLATASILMAGISTAVVISKRTLDSVSLQTASAASAQGGLQLLQNDLREAKQVDSRTATSIALKVPDRDSDGSPESIHYRWNATAGPLETSNDGVSWRRLTPNLNNMQVNWRTRPPQSIEPDAPLDASGSISYMSHASSARSDWTRNLTIAAPPGYIPGDACVAIVASANNPSSMGASGNWTKVSQTTRDNYLNLAVWHTTDAPDNTTFSWGSSAQAVGCIVHLTGNSSSPFVGIANLSGSGQLPAPAMAGSHSGEFVIRALAGIGSGVLSDTPAVLNHGAVLLRQVDLPSSSNDLTLAVACRSLPGGTIDAASFQFSPASVISCTTTVALRP